MEKSGKKLAAALVGTIMLIVIAVPSFGCGPVLDQAFFSYSLHPDFPLMKFAQGQLGIVRPTYARSYLVVAYRYLAGNPLSLSEQQACTDLWKARLLNDDTSSIDRYNSDVVQSWLKARQQVTPATVDQIVTYRDVADLPDSYSQFENCPDAAFKNAIKTLSERITKYGANSDYVKDWLHGQDNVFCHCGRSANYSFKKTALNPEGPFPGELPANADPQLKADRAYQLAAAHFYAKLYDKAEEEFLTIAHDANSPWQPMGLLLAARCLIRKGTLPDSVDKESLSKASDLLNQVLTDPKLSALHSEARGLLSFIELRTQPETQLTGLSKAVLDPTQANVFRQNLYDYTFLLDQYCPDATADNEQAATKKAQTMAAILKQDDLSDWLFTFQNHQGNESRARAILRWQSTHALPWLIAALSKAKPGDKEENELLKAARSIEPSSPAYLTASFYAINLLMKENKREEAARQLAKVLPVKMPPSAQNDFVDMQMMLSSTVAEFIKLTTRRPAGLFPEWSELEFPGDSKLFSLTDYAATAPICYTYKGANILNYNVPLKLLQEAVFKSGPPTNPRFDLAQAVWTRAVLLKQDAIALSLIPLLKSLRPQFAALYDDYANAKSPSERQFAATVFILKHPGSRPYVTPGAPRQAAYGRIEDYGDNWWSAEGFSGEFRADRSDSTAYPLSCPRFLTTADRAAAKIEAKAVKALGDAPNILSANVLAYAQSYPQDIRLPEALHNCVRATRFGHTNAKSSFYSKQAFRFLHQHYGKSSWAEQTPYYY